MKALLTIVLMVSGTLLPGCATARKPIVLEAVGPVSRAADCHSVGWLEVFSAYDVGLNDSHPDRLHHSDYKIFSPEGKLLQRVHNDTNTAAEGPVKIGLAPAKYRIEAPCNGHGLVSVPVTIAPNQTTVVHLEGGYTWPQDLTSNQSNTVRLPDGQIVGWRSSDDAPETRGTK